MITHKKISNKIYMLSPNDQFKRSTMYLLADYPEFSTKMQAFQIGKKKIKKLAEVNFFSLYF